jgi:hypothetical protein
MNTLHLSELLFIAKVERTFSIFKIIKNERRYTLNCSTLHGSLEVYVEDPNSEIYQQSLLVEGYHIRQES